MKSATALDVGRCWQLCRHRWAPGPEGRQALVGGTLIDGYGGPPVHDSVILVEDDQHRRHRHPGQHA